MINPVSPTVLLAAPLVVLVVWRVGAWMRASMSKARYDRHRPRSKWEQQSRREWWKIAGLVAFIPITMLIVNPLLALFLVQALRLPDQGPVTDAGVQFWVAACIPATVSVVGVGLMAREALAPDLRNKDAWWDVLLIMYPGMWALSLNGSHLTDYTPSDVSGRFDTSRFQAEFLQATAEPVLAVFFVGFLSMYAFAYADSRPSRRLRAAVAAAVYVVMVVVFVLVGRNADDGYW